MAIRIVRAVLYLRMSSAKQDTSIDAQRSAVEALARRQGYEIVCEYIDEAISGDDTLKRTAFLKMREDAAAGDFQVVLCWDQDRFGRFDPIEGGFWILPFRNAGVRLETIAQGKIDWTDFTGRLTYIVQQEGKHQYLRDLSRNVLRGHHAGAARGEWQGGPPPYGYRLLERMLSPDPEQAEIVRKIFALYVGGKSLREVADALNAEGVPSPGGKHWRFPYVRKLLTDDVYLGVFSYNKNPDSKYNHVVDGQIVPGSNRLKSRNYRTNAEPFAIADHHDAIIDRKTFSKAQRLLADRRREGPFQRKDRAPYPLGGLLRCAHCGALLLGQNKNYRKWSSRIYLCASYHTAGPSLCQRNYVHEEPILACIVRKLKAFWTSPKNLARLKAAICAEIGDGDEGQSKDRERLVREIGKLDEQIGRANGRLLSAPDSIYADLVEQIEVAKQDRSRLAAELLALEGQRGLSAAEADAMVAAAVEELQRLDENVSEGKPALVREAIRGLISHVEIRFRREKKRKTEKSVFDGGVIHVRPGLESIPAVLGGSTLGKSHSTPNNPRTSDG
jgi:site-specific DNA recombinase